MNRKLALLIGLLISDGSIYYDKSKTVYCIQFTNNDPVLLRVFRALMFDCFGVSKFSTNKCSNAISLRVFSSRIAKILLKYSTTYRMQACDNFPKCTGHSEHLFHAGVKYPPCKIPDEIISNPKFVASFLKGYASGDGSLYINKKYSIVRIELSCYHPFLRKQLNYCLSTLEISSRIVNKKVIVSGFTRCNRFLSLVNFIPEKPFVRSKSISSPDSQPNYPSDAVLRFPGVSSTEMNG